MFLIPSDFFQVKAVSGKGKGVFARKKIPQGTIIGDYLGKIIRPQDAEDGGLYLMYYSDHKAIWPDFSKPGVHLLNHSCEPNCWIYPYLGHTLVFSLMEIRPGEELTISYLLGPKEKCLNCDHQCLCGSKNCTGSFHLSEERYKAWRKIYNQLTRGVKKSPVKLGQNLEKLDHYLAKVNPQTFLTPDFLRT